MQWKQKGQKKAKTLKIFALTCGACFIHNRGKRDQTTKQKIERLFASLYPNKNLQEREINVFYFLARYGYELIDRIYDEVEVGLRDHKLINL